MICGGQVERPRPRTGLRARGWTVPDSEFSETARRLQEEGWHITAWGPSKDRRGWFILGVPKRLVQTELFEKSESLKGPSSRALNHRLANSLTQ